MMRLAAAPSLLLLAACAAGGVDRRVTWRDQSPHTTRMVTTAPGTTLEVLDWGGSGRPVVLLAGLGHTAHFYDGLAPALGDSFRVYGITRRGFGKSSQPPATGLAPLVSDIVAVLDSLGLGQVIFIGHSIAGEEMSAVAAAHPRRCGGLVYLDAAHDRSVLPQLFSSVRFPEPPAMTAEDSASVEAVVAYHARVQGFRFPEADVREVMRFDSTGRFVGQVTPQSVAMGIVSQLRPPDYRQVHCRSLAIYAVADSAPALAEYALLDSAGKAMLTAAFPAVRDFRRRGLEQYRRDMAGGRAVLLPGAHHYVMMSHREQTMAAIRTFLDSL